MDKALREEYRADKVEVHARLKQLEKSVQELSTLVEALTAPKAETRSTASADGKK